ncbi:MAG: hypothetical protein CM15mP59_1790 [Flavobacteriaceae bacterium]|nr:MAG: hypothetical protein CM15mP59_1790 [Flavobacteriaceae bacterium]
MLLSQTGVLHPIILASQHLQKEADVRLSIYKENSLQGDRVLMNIYEQLGVKSSIENNTLHLQKQALKSTSIQLDLSNAPDIAQT